jgi:hypothetical protein
MNNPIFPKHAQLTLPLRTVLDEHNGLRAKDATAAVAARLALPPEVTEATNTLPNGRRIHPFGRRVRWVRQTLVGSDLISGRHLWLVDVNRSRQNGPPELQAWRYHHRVRDGFRRSAVGGSCPPSEKFKLLILYVPALN